MCRGNIQSFLIGRLLSSRSQSPRVKSGYENWGEIRNDTDGNQVAGLILQGSEHLAGLFV